MSFLGKKSKKMTRLFFATDIHGSERTYRKFINAGKFYEANVIVMGGDISGKLMIPIIKEGNGHYRGVEAVIDKDLAGERLAEVVNADTLLILTDVEKAKLNFGKPNEQEVGKITLAQAKQYLAEGHFLAGSMGPKVRACIRFLEWGVKRAVITSLDKAVEALNDTTGTQITLG